MKQKTINTVMVTGNEGYIGSVLTNELASNGYCVVGFDLGLFTDASYVPRMKKPDIQIHKDIRDIEAHDLEGIDAIIHLAGLSNDPVGSLEPEITFDINFRASIRLAELAKKEGIKRFLFSSSCSLYGAQYEGDTVTETSCLQPLTPYAESKVLTEEALRELADSYFNPISLRNATVFGISPRLRLDLVVQNLIASALLTNTITIQSDGTPWRPLVHVDDIARAFLFFLTAPEELTYNQSINVGNQENTSQVKMIAERIQAFLPQSNIDIKNANYGDMRSYRVNFSKLESLGFKPRISLNQGIKSIIDVFQQKPLPQNALDSDPYITLIRYKKLIADGILSKKLRRISN